MNLSAEVGSRVRKRGLVARTVGIKVRFADFRTLTRVRSLPTWTDATNLIHQVAGELYDGLDLDRPRIRLLGVKVEGLREPGDAPEQLTLDASSDQLAADRTLDEVRSRFGNHALGFATLLTSSRDRQAGR